MADRREPIQKITDSQKSERMEALGRRKAGLAGSVTRHYTLLVTAVTDKDLVAATSAYETIKTSFTEFCDIHGRYMNLLGSDDQELALKAGDLYDETIQKMNTSHKTYGTLLKTDRAAPLIKPEMDNDNQSHDGEDTLQSTITPEDSASQLTRYSNRSRSSRASRSSMASSLAKAAAHKKTVTSQSQTFG